MASAQPHPRVGVAALVRNDKNQFVFGRRRGSHGSGHWQFPGGHLEYGETYFQCAERETLEETGLKVKAVKLVTATNDVFHDAGKHYITLFVLCEMEDPHDLPQNMEPTKCDGWQWTSWGQLKDWAAHQDDQGAPWTDRRLFLPMVNLVDQVPEL